MNRNKFLSVKTLLTFFILFLVTGVYAQINRQRPFNDTLPPVHDPVIIQQDSIYYIFCTGMGIAVFSSKDMKHWKRAKPVFDKAPDWTKKLLPGFTNREWAPDISFHNNQFYLYYSVSSFGKNTSAIGVATNKTLDTLSKDFKWTDHGKVIESVPGRDMWNAIDPNLIIDENNIPWLAFGSFWNGIKLVKLSNDLTAIAQPETWYTIAARKRDFTIPDSVAGDAAIEGPFIYKHDNFYYLFVSFDYCCRGEKSNYKMMVGRSEKVYGPYIDRKGVPMNSGGGSVVLEGNKNWYGVGHNAVAAFSGSDYLVFHAYDANDNGRSKLQIEKIAWVNGWPYVGTTPKL